MLNLAVCIGQLGTWGLQADHRSHAPKRYISNTDGSSKVVRLGGSWYKTVTHL